MIDIPRKYILVSLLVYGILLFIVNINIDWIDKSQAMQSFGGKDDIISWTNMNFLGWASQGNNTSQAELLNYLLGPVATL